MMRTLGLVMTAVLTLVAAPTLAAADGVKRVAYSDLQLESDVGRAELQRRLDRAVRSICSVDGAPQSAALTAEQARCVADTSASLGGSMDAAIRANRASATATETAARN